VKRHLKIQVRDLVSYCLRSGDLVQEFLGGIRAVDGIRSHQIVQESRPEDYQAEVSVSHQVEADDFIVDIGGRMDGVYRYPDHAVIDEIKSTTRSLESIEKEQKPIHWGQVKVYAYFYALGQGLQTIDVQLTYYHLDSAEIREFRQTVTLEELTLFFNDLLRTYLEWATMLDQWQRTRDESIRGLLFPFAGFRLGQRQMVSQVYHAIQGKEQLIVEAPTGIGKTMAVVFPAVKALGKGFMDKFFYLTAKTTGRAIAQNALQDLRSKGLHLKSLTLTAKEKICFSPGSACNGEECEFARGYFDRINEAVKTIFAREALTRDLIETFARQFTVCPFEFSLELSLWVDTIICDYNYAFDPRVYLRRFFGEESRAGNYVFLVDEANNLVDRSREMFSAELFKQSFLDLRRLVKKDLPELSRSIGAVNSQLLKFKNECEEAGKPLAREKYPPDLSPPLRRFIRAAEHWLVRHIKAPFNRELLAMYFEVSWFLKVADNYHSAYTTCYEEIGGDFRVKLFCMDHSVQLSEAFDRCNSAVFFSATLSPLHYFRRILGCDPSAQEMILPSPFPGENFCLPLADRVSTLYKFRERTKVQVTRIINVLVRQQPGNYLIFFPSYQYLKMIHDLVVMMNPAINHLVQFPGMKEAERDAFLGKFAVDNRSQGKTLVGFAVMGGVFGEGIDLVGDRLTGAAVVGVGLPGISLERELIKEYFENLQGTGFQYAYLYPGMNRVFQAAGRVIRTSSDRGVVLLIGSRFSTDQYRSLLPGHWRPCRVRDDRHLEEILGQFWNSASSGQGGELAAPTY
jgi:DNA excision repair protein ERCC-2